MLTWYKHTDIYIWINHLHSLYIHWGEINIAEGWQNNEETPISGQMFSLIYFSPLIMKEIKIVTTVVEIYTVYVSS